MQKHVSAVLVGIESPKEAALQMDQSIEDSSRANATAGLYAFFLIMISK